MAANDNAMTRFLFAILQQKCLKDIDWNKVARDPILAQEISNGHAARMRYSRFRSAMLGIEPTKRNRANQNRNRVAKKKKDDVPATTSSVHPKQEPDAIAHEPGTQSGFIKHEPRSTDSPQARHLETPMAMMAPSPKVKEEHLLFSVLDQPRQPPSQQQAIFNFSDMQAARAQMRMLTPSSDSDPLQQYAAHHSHSHSPASDGLLDATAAASPFDFGHGGESAQHEWHNHQHHHHHHQSSPYAAGFVYGTGAEGFSPGAAFGAEHEHHQMHHHLGVVPDELGVHDALLEHEMGGGGQGMVKHEEWDAHGTF